MYMRMRTIADEWQWKDHSHHALQTTIRALSDERVPFALNFFFFNCGAVSVKARI